MVWLARSAAWMLYNDILGRKGVSTRRLWGPACVRIICGNILVEEGPSSFPVARPG